MNRDTQKFYDRISPLYPLIDFFLKPQKNALTHYLNEQKDGKLLEIGVGNGSNLLHLKKHEITGIDLSEEMLKLARKRLPNPKISLQKMDGENLTFAPNTFDYIIISHVLSVTQDPDKMLNEVHRVLRPKGKICILNHFTPNNYLKNIDKSFSYFSQFLKFKSNFTPENINLSKFTPIQEKNLGFMNYYKLIIMEK